MRARACRAGRRFMVWPGHLNWQEKEKRECKDCNSDHSQNQARVIKRGPVFARSADLLASFFLPTLHFGHSGSVVWMSREPPYEKTQGCIGELRIFASRIHLMLLSRSRADFPPSIGPVRTDPLDCGDVASNFKRQTEAAFRNHSGSGS
jgi:hypothetical protein